MKERGEEGWKVEGGIGWKLEEGNMIGRGRKDKW